MVTNIWCLSVAAVGIGGGVGVAFFGTQSRHCTYFFISQKIVCSVYNEIFSSTSTHIKQKIVLSENEFQFVMQIYVRR